MGEKNYPYQIKEHYIPSLNSLRRIYTQHPKYNGNVLLIYELLFDYWNPKYGYAFPTIWDLSRDSGLGESTVKRCLTVLGELDLIKKKRSKVANNNVYEFNKPVETLEELITKFPEVEEYHRRRTGSIDERERVSKSRWSNKQQEEEPAKKVSEKASLEDWF